METKEKTQEHKAPARVVTFFLYSPDEVHGPVGIRTDVEELGGWDTTLFIMEKKGPHLWVGTLTLPEGVTKKHNNVVANYKYPYIANSIFLSFHLFLLCISTFPITHYSPPLPSISPRNLIK